jgi:hypothetical protein
MALLIMFSSLDAVAQDDGKVNVEKIKANQDNFYQNLVFSIENKEKNEKSADKLKTNKELLESAIKSFSNEIFFLKDKKQEELKNYVSTLISRISTIQNQSELNNVLKSFLDLLNSLQASASFSYDGKTVSAKTKNVDQSFLLKYIDMSAKVNQNFSEKVDVYDPNKDPKVKAVLDAAKIAIQNKQAEYSDQKTETDSLKKLYDNHQKFVFELEKKTWEARTEQKKSTLELSLVEKDFDRYNKL